MDCCQCHGIEDVFNAEFVERERAQYHKRGPEKTTRVMVDALKAAGVQGLTLLDIGGGVGAIQHDLMRAGLSHAIDVDASNSYLHAAMQEADERGMSDRISFKHGNFIDLAPDIPDVDIVTLDRVICCYPDMPDLVRLSAEHARKFYSVVYPRDSWLIKAGIRMLNFFFWLRKEPFRTFIHPTQVVDDIIRSNGFEKQFSYHTPIWQVFVYKRSPEGVG